MMRFASRVEPAGGRVRPLCISVRRFGIALITMGLICVPVAPAASQPGDSIPSGRTAEADVQVEIPVALKVTPDAPVSVELPAEDGGPDTARVTVSCAGNVPHTVEIRGTADRADVEWKTGDSGWKPLSPRPRPVAEGLAPGRHEECATVQLRHTHAADPEPGHPHRVEVDFVVHRAG